MSERIRQFVPAVAGLVLFIVALEVLRIELRSVSWDQVRLEVSHLPQTRLIGAIALTILNYLVLTGYDLLAFAYIGRALPRLRIALTSLLAYAIANSVGFAMLSGASVRYRFYTRWGITAEELSRIVFSYSVTFWLGLFALGGASLALTPLADLTARRIGELAVPAGWLLSLTPVAYVVATTIRQQPVRVWRLELPIPRPLIALGQLVLSCVDWALAGAVLYVLLPPGAVPFVPFLAVFLVAILLGLASHVPGGLGVFETLMVLLLKPFLPSSQVLPALVVYRVIYYLAPLSIALVALVFDELQQRGTQARRVGKALGRATEQVTPRVLAVVTFIAGIVLLISGATPGRQARLALLGRVLPLGVIEASHFIGSIVGAGPARPVARTLSSSRWRLLRHGRPGHGRHRRIAAQGIRLRRGEPAADSAAGAVAGAARLQQTRGVSRRAVLAWLDCRRPRCTRRIDLARACSRSSTCSIRMSCGGSSSCIAMRRASCARRSGRRSSSCSSGCRESSARRATTFRLRPTTISGMRSRRSRRRRRPARTSCSFATRRSSSKRNGAPS
jgi:uncharacterized membrane protein YbhN (UPF0104 family)